VAREGDKFISNNQGLRLSSIRTSNPNNSKQLFLFTPNLLRLSTTIGSTDISDFIIKSYI
jgi:hypothetical protein